jgi:hypothetical protein
MERGLEEVEEEKGDSEQGGGSNRRKERKGFKSVESAMAYKRRAETVRPGHKPCIHLTPFSLHSTLYALHSKPYTLHPIPNALRSKPYTLHSTSFAPHPNEEQIPCVQAPIPTPYTLYPVQQRRVDHVCSRLQVCNRVPNFRPSKTPKHHKPNSKCPVFGAQASTRGQPVGGPFIFQTPELRTETGGKDISTTAVKKALRMRLGKGSADRAAAVSVAIPTVRIQGGEDEGAGGDYSIQQREEFEYSAAMTALQRPR